MCEGRGRRGSVCAIEWVPRNGHAQARVRIDAAGAIYVGLVREGAGWEGDIANTGWACRRGRRGGMLAQQPTIGACGAAALCGQRSPLPQR